MNETLYEFSSEVPDRPRRKWPAALLLFPVIALAVWGVSILEQKRAEFVVNEFFQLKTDTDGRVVIAVAKVFRINDDSMRGLTYYPHLHTVDLRNTLSGTLQPLREIENLHVLGLRACSWVDDDQVASIRNLDGLEDLLLSGTSVTDAGLDALRDLKHLKRLELSGIKMTDARLEMFANMRQLRMLSLNGTGCSADALFSLRERRRDLMLRLNAADFLNSEDRFSRLSVWPPFHLSGVEDPPDIKHSVTAPLSTANDVKALSLLLRLKHNWHPSQHGGPTPSGSISIPDESNYLEHIEETWTSLSLSGPPAGSSLKTILPLTPRLAELSLNNTTITPADFPVDLAPPELHQLRLWNMDVSLSLLQDVLRQTAVNQIELGRVRVDELEIAFARFGRTMTSLQRAGVGNGGDNEQAATAIEIHEAEVRRSLETLAPLAPDLAVLELRHATLEAEQFPFGLLPSRLHVKDVQMTEAFLQKLARDSAIKHLVLYSVTLDGVNPDDPALKQFPSLQSLRIHDVTINGVALTDPSLEPLRERLTAALPDGMTRITSSPNPREQGAAQKGGGFSRFPSGEDEDE